MPISTAVRASTALPMVYEPVRVRDRELIDGGIVSTTNIDVAVEAGAKLVVVVNPLVPYVNDFSHDRPDAVRLTRPRHVSDMGLPQIGYQAFKLMAYQRLHEMARQWEDRYPGVDIVLIEPEPDDELMFQTSIMNFASRIDIARHGFESVTLKLATEYESFHEICQRHGIEISATRVRKVVKHFAAEKERTRAWRKILEQATPSLLRQSRDVRERLRHAHAARRPSRRASASGRRASASARPRPSGRSSAAKRQKLHPDRRADQPAGPDVADVLEAVEADVAADTRRRRRAPRRAARSGRRGAGGSTLRSRAASGATSGWRSAMIACARASFSGVCRVPSG